MVIIGNTGEDPVKWIETNNLQKKRPQMMGSLMALPNKVFPCSHFSVKPLLHTHLDYVIKFFFVGKLNWMLLNRHMCQFPISGYKEKHP